MNYNDKETRVCMTDESAMSIIPKNIFQGNNNSKILSHNVLLLIFRSHISFFGARTRMCCGHFKVKLSPEVNSEPTQTSKMGLFLVIVNGLHPLTIFAKSFM